MIKLCRSFTISTIKSVKATTHEPLLSNTKSACRNTKRKNFSIKNNNNNNNSSHGLVVSFSCMKNKRCWENTANMKFICRHQTASYAVTRSRVFMNLVIFFNIICWMPITTHKNHMKIRAMVAMVIRTKGKFTTRTKRFMIFKHFFFLSLSMLSKGRERLLLWITARGKAQIQREFVGHSF